MCPALLYTGYDDLLSIISDYFDINRFLSVSVDLVRVSGQYVKFDDAYVLTPRYYGHFLWPLQSIDILGDTWVPLGLRGWSIYHPKKITKLTFRGLAFRHRK